MPRKNRHANSTPPPPQEIRGFLSAVGEVVREILESNHRPPSIIPDNTDMEEHQDEGSSVYPGER